MLLALLFFISLDPLHPQVVQWGGPWLICGISEPKTIKLTILWEDPGCYIWYQRVTKSTVMWMCGNCVFCKWGWQRTGFVGVWPQPDENVRGRALTGEFVMNHNSEFVMNHNSHRYWVVQWGGSYLYVGSMTWVVTPVRQKKEKKNPDQMNDFVFLLYFCRLAGITSVNSRHPWMQLR